MLDINYIINNKEEVKELLKRKNFDADIDSLVDDLLEKEDYKKKLNLIKQNKTNYQNLFQKLKKLAEMFKLSL